MRFINFKDLPAFSEDIVFDEIPFTFEFIWNSREEIWELNIYNKENESLIYGIPIVINYELISNYNYIEGFPKGQLYAIREDLSFNEITQNEFFTGNCKLIYFEENEI